MKTNRWIFLSIGMLLGYVASAQNKYTINGYISDSLTGESVISANITIDGKAVASNPYGFYSLTMPEGEYELTVSHISYVTTSFKIRLDRNMERNIRVVSKSAALNEVIVYSRIRDANVRNAQMGKVDLSIGQIKNIPAFLGEVDILKAIQLLPGVQTAGEGNSGFYVRGGGPDQNLIILDDAVVYLWREKPTCSFSFYTRIIQHFLCFATMQHATLINWMMETEVRISDRIHRTDPNTGILIIECHGTFL